MRRTTKRWLLSPITQRRASTLARQQGTGINVEIAWILVRLRRNPAEADYALSVSDLPISQNPGIHYDNWDSLSDHEKARRESWIARHGRSPFQQLGIEHDFLVRAGIEVIDWGQPPTASGDSPPHPDSAV